ncbi:MAG: glycosyltransferase family 2 protein [Clostridia bacterium]|nr:MAG: glycosyltransferase family 2 protein [Clostridia bacterium]
MGETPKVSIIVPIYNVEQYLRQCLDSLVNQTYKNIEIICVDDGSTDNSGEILNQYAEYDARISVFHVENAGVSSARSKALSYASGKYIMYVDGDDWIDVCTCEKAIFKAEEHAADLVMWPYIREFPNHSAPKAIFLVEKTFTSAECRELQRRMIGLLGTELAIPENADALCTVWGKLYLRELIAQNDIRFTDLRRIGTYEDGLFNLHYLSHVKNAIYIPDYLSHYRKNSGMTSKFRKELAAQWKNLFSDMRSYIELEKCGGDFDAALNNRISLSIIGLGLNALALPNREALKEIRGILSEREYRAAIKTLPMRYFPPHWWAFFACCKLNFAAGVFFLLKCMERIKK